MNKFWLENPSNLFKSIQIVPHTNMDITEQFNSITRLVLLFTLVMWLFDFKYTMQFMIFSLLFIIIIYYIQMNKSKENFENPVYTGYTPTSKISSVRTKNDDKITFTTGESLRYCNDNIDIDVPNSAAFTLNQNLSNSNADANPLTKIKPVVVPPIYDLESWRDNNLVTYSIINSPGVQQDMYLSGYAVSTCCGYLPPNTERVPIQKNQIENYGITAPVPVQTKTRVPYVENYCTGDKCSPNIRNLTEPRPNSSGWVNTTCGYNPEQVNVNLPTNLPVGTCDKSPEMAQYNKNLFTQIVTPGVYSINQVNEPINSNIGISFTQQIEPTTVSRDENGLTYTLHDPRIIEPSYEVPSESVKAKYDNVYDPRFYGYGTSYRSYLEPVTGQTRFMYEDVNAIRMPNYVTRSKIDHLNYADSYGPMQPGSEMGNDINANIRDLVQDSWFRDSLQFREDLQQSRMRKVNAEGWQKRMYPNSSRPVGSSFVQKH